MARLLFDDQHRLGAAAPERNPGAGISSARRRAFPRQRVAGNAKDEFGRLIAGHTKRRLAEVTAVVLRDVLLILDAPRAAAASNRQKCRRQYRFRNAQSSPPQKVSGLVRIGGKRHPHPDGVVRAVRRIDRVGDDYPRIERRVNVGDC